MEDYKYRYLLWQLIATMDSGKYDNLSIQEVQKHAEAETIPAFLIDHFGSDLDLSMMKSQDWIELSGAWARIHNAIDAKRKFGVDNRGICLLMAYTLESIQMIEHLKEKEYA